MQGHDRNATVLGALRGDVFMEAVDTAIESIRDPPIAWGFYRERERTPQIYSRNVAGFPFDIVCLLIDGEIYSVAYAHERRRPGHWSPPARAE